MQVEILLKTCTNTELNALNSELRNAFITY